MLGRRASLRQAESATDLAAAGLPVELRAALEVVAPVYRRAQWDVDARTDRELIARLSPLVQRFGPALAKTLGAAYRTPWPTVPVRVDIAAFAGPVGAYTSDSVTMAAHDPRHAGDAALEILFHEASHLLVVRVEEAIVARCRAQNQPVPPTLWHALIFFTTGDLVRRQLGPDYVPYADRGGLWKRSPEWSRYRPLLERTWITYLNGRTSLESAIDALLAPDPA